MPLFAAGPGVFTISCGALAVQAGAGTLLSGHRVQAHPVEQLGGLLVDIRRTVVSSSRAEVSGFHARHAPRLRPRH